MFNLLIGQGLSLVIVTVQNLVKTGDSGFTLNKPENEEWVTPLCFYTVVISLTVGVGAAAFNKFTYTKVTAGILLGLYGIFMIICILGEIEVNGNSLLPFLK